MILTSFEMEPQASGLWTFQGEHSADLMTHSSGTVPRPLKDGTWPRAKGSSRIIVGRAGALSEVTVHCRPGPWNKEQEGERKEERGGWEKCQTLFPSLRIVVELPRCTVRLCDCRLNLNSCRLHPEQHARTPHTLRHTHTHKLWGPPHL